LLDGRLRHLMDTTDIVQSLLKNFLYQGVKEGPTAQDTAGLCAYLAAAVHHKIRTKTRKEHRHKGSLSEVQEPVCSEPPAGSADRRPGPPSGHPGSTFRADSPGFRPEDAGPHLGRNRRAGGWECGRPADAAAPDRRDGSRPAGARGVEPCPINQSAVREPT